MGPRAILNMATMRVAKALLVIIAWVPFVGSFTCMTFVPQCWIPPEPAACRLGTGSAIRKTVCPHSQRGLVPQQRRIGLERYCDPAIHFRRNGWSMRWATESSKSVAARLKYRCELCNCAFERKKNWQQHMEGQQHRTNEDSVDTTWEQFIACALKWDNRSRVSDDHERLAVGGETVLKEEVVQAWSPEELERFPMRATCLSPRTFFDDLPLLSKARLWKYVSELMPYNGAEVPTVLFAGAVEHARLFRVKEVVEACEAFKLAETFIVSARRRRPVRALVEGACGHALLGMLLAYRFPHLEVLAVDLEERAAVRAWRECWQAHGAKLPHWPAPLHNFRFQRADLAAAPIPPDACLLALHACREVNVVAIEAARAAGALWAVMPCCVPAPLYLPGCSLRLPDGGEERARHQFMCGVIAARYEAQVVTSIDARISNRNIFIAGNGSESAPDKKLASRN